MTSRHLDRPGHGGRYVRRYVRPALRTVAAGLLGPDRFEAVGPAMVAGGRVRWWWLPVRLISPGSVPLAVLFFATGASLAGNNYGIGGPFQYLYGLGVAVPIVLAAYQPLLAWTMTFVTFWMYMGTSQPMPPGEPWPWPPTSLLPYCVVQYAVARVRGVGVAMLSWALIVAVGVLLMQGRPVPGTPENLTLLAVLAALALAIGIAVRVASRSRVQLAEESRLTAEERARRQLLEERTRIARELHDVVAHHMSVIAVQASTAEYRVGGLTEETAQEFRSISAQARESLHEMRRLLSVLRRDDEGGLRAPQPGLDRLGSLIDAAERAGTPVELVMRTSPDDVPERVSLTAYRIVQEALSNVVRHASGAVTRVEIVGWPERLSVTVVNEPPPAGKASLESMGEGHGLPGMRERVALIGGELVAEPRAGGFIVAATLPVTALEEEVS